MSESRVIIIVVQDSDEGGACGATGRRTSVLNHHHQLVTRLLLSVQNRPCTDLTWGEKGVDERDFNVGAQVQSTGIMMRASRL